VSATKRRALGAAALLACAALLVLAAGAVRPSQHEIALSEVWDDVEAGRWDSVLERTDLLLGAAGAADVGDAAARAAELRCWALLALQRREACGALLDGVLDGRAAAAGWLPDPLLIRIAIGARSARGDLQSAAALAQRAAAAHPDDVALLQLELETRAAIGDEASLLAEFEQRLSAAGASAGEELALRVALASRHRHRADWPAALRVLGTVPQPRPEAGEAAQRVAQSWFDEHTAALAALGRLADLRASFALQAERGADPFALRAGYALRLSVSQLVDPDASWAELLQGAIEAGAERLAPRTRVELHERLIAHHLADAEPELAIAAFDRAEAAGLELLGITREQLERGNLAERDAGPGMAAGTLVFRVPAALPGAELRVSNSDGEPDAPFEAVPIVDGVAVAERRAAAWPERWVLHDAQGKLRASGSAWARPAARLDIAIELRPPAPRVATPALARAAADGRTRVFLVLLDSGDWRLTQYLRERGELPTLDALIARGHRAVLRSDPPLTAAAMERLVWPERGGVSSFVGVVHELGVELAGLASVGRNPFEFLGALLPEGASLFEAIGSGPRVAANMLFTHGLIDAGRHAEMIGPHGQRRTVQTARAQRPLRPDERERFAGIDANPRARSHVESIAAELDAAIELAHSGEVDFLALRLESFDILTHALFSELATTAQDDGRSNLLAVYRYVDARLADLDATLDADDVLVVMSDHGAKTAMEHAPDAIFIAAGNNIPPGRAPGRPDLAGVPKVLAAMLGKSTPWPDTGLAPYQKTRLAKAERSDAKNTIQSAP
jgi:hypothetical protein